jgi:hypothetical protein
LVGGDVVWEDAKHPFNKQKNFVWKVSMAIHSQEGKRMLK